MSAATTDGLSLQFAGIEISVDCHKEHAPYCQFLAGRIEPTAAEILRASPDIKPVEMVFLVALSLADEIYGQEFDWEQGNKEKNRLDYTAAPATEASDETIALRGMFRDLS